jgi:hypothetical protein
MRFHAHMAPRALALAASLLAVVALGGCGGGDDDGAPASQDTPTAQQSETPTATAEPTPDPEEDEAIVRRAQLRLEDFPSDWQEQDEDQTDTSDCDGVQEAREAANARERSPQFSQGENTAAQSVVYTFVDEEQASEMFAKLSSRELRTCLGEELADTVADVATGADAGELTIGEASTARIQVDPLGDEREGGRVTLPLETQGLELELTVDYVAVRVGRGLALLQMIDLGPFDEDLRADLTSKVVRRLAVGLN